MKLEVNTFYLGSDKDAALKPLEEAAEAFAAWQRLDLEYARANDEKAYMTALRGAMAYEIADVIQAACNLATRYDLDLESALKDVEKHNRERGRYD